MREISARWVAACALLVACNFSGSPGNGGAPDARPEADAAPEDAMAIDADPICDAMTLRLRVDGETWAEGDEARARRTGDTVSLNAAASCSPTGNLTFTWDFKGGDFVPRSRPAEGPVVEVYPDAVGNRTLTLTLSDGTNDVVADVVFDVAGFALLDKLGGSAVVRQMVTGDDQLWLATDRGPFTTPLADLDNGGDAYTDVNSIPNDPTETIPQDLDFVAFDPDNDTVSWVSLNSDDKAGFFFDRDGGDITTQTISDGGAVTSIGHLPPDGGLRVVTTDGTRTSDDYTTFIDEIDQEGLRVAIVQDKALLGGGDQLYLLDDDPSDNPRSIFEDGDDESDSIRTFFIDADERLWIGSSDGGADHGVGIIDDFADDTIDRELLGTSIRAIAQDGDGDMWVATGTGIARFKADWQRWIRLDSDNGLDDVDVRTLIVDEAGGRQAILAGTANGLFVLR